MIIPIILLIAGALGTPSTTSALQVDGQSNPETLGAYVRGYYASEPILADIAWCESRMRQVNSDGTVYRGKINNDDIGVMQINSQYHEATATDMGLDIYSLDGNLKYAEYLYDKQGTKPWNSSKACWGSKVVTDSK